jgi:hypothetical protein
MGCDLLPCEALKSNEACALLLTLFNKCWISGIVPELWRRSIINPIPKSSSADRRIPMNYRGISLTSSVYKIYCSIINERLQHWTENHDLINDEQNGFRKNRGCADHLATLASVIEGRKQQRKSTFACFIDFSKAYDSISRSLLWYKMDKLGLSGNILSAIKSIRRL